MINTYAKKGSGGICFYIKLSILENYIIEGIDKCYDGKQAISFTHKICYY